MLTKYFQRLLPRGIEHLRSPPLCACDGRFRRKVHSNVAEMQKFVSQKKRAPLSEIEKEKIPKTHHVWVSSSQNIFTNLALEDWIFQNLDFTNMNLLLLWRNEPCVVIGRHQNPWVECNVAATRHAEVDIARRFSGGGTVYHDLGNMCLTFFTSRDRYDRRYNLEFIKRTLTDIWNIDITLADRDDILFDKKYKISGTAAKLIRKKAYHHCTLLLDADVDDIDKYLHTHMDGLKSKATTSVRSQIRNLSEFDPNIHFNYLVPAFSKEYRKQSEKGTHLVVNPDDPASDRNIQDARKELKSWKWAFGKTPDFSIHQSYRGAIDIELIIHTGHISDVNITDVGHITRQQDLDTVKHALVGKRLNHEELNMTFNELLSDASDDSLPSIMTLCQAFENIVENA